MQNFPWRDSNPRLQVSSPTFYHLTYPVSPLCVLGVGLSGWNLNSAICVTAKMHLKVVIALCPFSLRLVFCGKFGLRFGRRYPSLNVNSSIICQGSEAESLLPYVRGIGEGKLAPREAIISYRRHEAVQPPLRHVHLQIVCRNITRIRYSLNRFQVLLGWKEMLKW